MSHLLQFDTDIKEANKPNNDENPDEETYADIQKPTKRSKIRSTGRNIKPAPSLQKQQIERTQEEISKYKYKNKIINIINYYTTGINDNSTNNSIRELLNYFTLNNIPRIYLNSLENDQYLFIKNMYNIFKTIQFICLHANDNIASYLSESYVVDKEKILFNYNIYKKNSSIIQHCKLDQNFIDGLNNFYIEQIRSIDRIKNITIKYVENIDEFVLDDKKEFNILFVSDISIINELKYKSNVLCTLILEKHNELRDIQEDIFVKKRMYFNIKHYEHFLDRLALFIRLKTNKDNNSRSILCINISKNTPEAESIEIFDINRYCDFMISKIISKNSAIINLFNFTNESTYNDTDYDLPYNVLFMKQTNIINEIEHLLTKFFTSILSDTDKGLKTYEIMRELPSQDTEINYIKLNFDLAIFMASSIRNRGSYISLDCNLFLHNTDVKNVVFYNPYFLVNKELIVYGTEVTLEIKNKLYELILNRKDRNEIFQEVKKEKENFIDRITIDRIKNFKREKLAKIDDINKNIDAKSQVSSASSSQSGISFIENQSRLSTTETTNKRISWADIQEEAEKEKKIDKETKDVNLEDVELTKDEFEKIDKRIKKEAELFAKSKWRKYIFEKKIEIIKTGKFDEYIAETNKVNQLLLSKKNEYKQARIENRKNYTKKNIINTPEQLLEFNKKKIEVVPNKIGNFDITEWCKHVDHCFSYFKNTKNGKYVFQMSKNKFLPTFFIYSKLYDFIDDIASIDINKTNTELETPVELTKKSEDDTESLPAEEKKEKNINLKLKNELLTYIHGYVYTKWLTLKIKNPELFVIDNKRIIERNVNGEIMVDQSTAEMKDLAKLEENDVELVSVNEPRTNFPQDEVAGGAENEDTPKNPL